jgi:predicted component of type VI protein secretion system
MRSREDVVKQLGIICDFLTRTEPSSPIIYILRRAQRMVGMDFLQVVTELSLAGGDARAALLPAMGIGLPELKSEVPSDSTSST